MLASKDLLAAISGLPSKTLRYVSGQTSRRVHLLRVEKDGSIAFRRYDPSKGQKATAARDESIPAALIERVASAIRAHKPFNIDSVVKASYNSRSVLESLLAHTPHFFVTYPGRYELNKSGKRVIRKGHKHLVWEPGHAHANGKVEVRSGYKPVD